METSQRYELRIHDDEEIAARGTQCRSVLIDAFACRVQVRFNITIRDGCWDGFRFVRVQTLSDDDKATLVTCFEAWQVPPHPALIHLCPASSSDLQTCDVM